MTKHEEDLLLLAWKILADEKSKRSTEFIASMKSRRACNKSQDLNKVYLSFVNKAMDGIDKLMEMRKNEYWE